MEHNLAFDSLFKEIKENHDQMDEFINDYERVKNDWLNLEKNEMIWIPNKNPSFGFSNYLYQYFPCSAFFYFMNGGFILNLKKEEHREILMKIYAITNSISQLSQYYEEKISFEKMEILLNKYRLKDHTDIPDFMKYDEMISNFTDPATTSLLANTYVEGKFSPISDNSETTSNEEHLNRIRIYCEEIRNSYWSKHEEYIKCYTKFMNIDKNEFKF